MPLDIHHQKVIQKKLASYLRLVHPTIKRRELADKIEQEGGEAGGFCFGLSTIHSAMRITGQLPWWESVLNAIYSWSGEKTELYKEFSPTGNPAHNTTLEHLCEKVLSYMLFHQTDLAVQQMLSAPEATPLYSQLNILDPQTGCFEILHPTTNEVLKVRANHRLPGMFSPEDLTGILQELIPIFKKWQPIIILSSAWHAINIAYDSSSNQWAIYDPHYATPTTLTFSSSDEAVQEIKKCLGSLELEINIAFLQDVKLRIWPEHYETYIRRDITRILGEIFFESKILSNIPLILHLMTLAESDSTIRDHLVKWCMKTENVIIPWLMLQYPKIVESLLQLAQQNQDIRLQLMSKLSLIPPNLQEFRHSAELLADLILQNPEQQYDLMSSPSTESLVTSILQKLEPQSRGTSKMLLPLTSRLIILERKYCPIANIADWEKILSSPLKENTNFLATMLTQRPETTKGLCELAKMDSEFRSSFTEAFQQAESSLRPGDIKYIRTQLQPKRNPLRRLLDKLPFSDPVDEDSSTKSRMSAPLRD